MHTRLAAVVAISALLACASCSSSSNTTPTTVTQTIGPEGGSIVVDGATVTFPNGALGASKVITISVTDSVPDGFVALSRVFKCEPSGTDFAQPVTMQMPFTDDGKGGTMFWSSGADPAFKNLGGVAKDGRMTATVMHFSSGFVGRAK
jgi:ZU5 domain